MDTLTTAQILDILVRLAHVIEEIELKIQFAKISLEDVNTPLMHKCVAEDMAALENKP